MNRIGESPEVSVVIPTYNRGSLLSRAVLSALRQAHVVEVIVIDDGSTDSTAEVVRALEGERIVYLNNEVRVGGAAARNVGIEHAKSEYVAFLDSDDEWLPGHISDSLALMADYGFRGVCSSFFVERRGHRRPFLCAPIPEGQCLAEYILNSGGGDARSSTFVFERDALSQVLFDPTLKKHQDWDLAIRFSKLHRFGAKTTPSVVIHLDHDDRMSGRNNPEATAVFMSRYASEVTAAAAARSYTRLMLKTLREGAHEEAYRDYRRRAWSLAHRATLRTKVELTAMSWPALGSMLLTLESAASGLNVRRRADPTAVSPDRSGRCWLSKTCVLEMVGVPGAGKSTVSHRLAAVHPAGLRIDSARNIAWCHHYVAAFARVLWRAGGTIIRQRDRRMLYLAKLVRFEVLQRVVHGLRRSDQRRVIIFDQGLFYSFMWLTAHMPAHRSKRFQRHWKSCEERMAAAVDLIVMLDADQDDIWERIHSRNKNHHPWFGRERSYVDTRIIAWRTRLEAAMKLLNGGTERIPVTRHSTSRVDADELADRIVAMTTGEDEIQLRDSSKRRWSPSRSA
jgi:glycosyltransferase involved in cell wall biosynthesis